MAIFSTAQALWFGMKGQTIKSKQEQTDAPHRCAGGAHTRGFPSARGAVCPFFYFFCFSRFSISDALVRKNCRKCQEEPSNGRTELLGDDSRDGSNESTENKPNRVIMPSCLTRKPSFCSAS